MIPSVISGWPNSAVSEATIMSQSSASSQPPPSAQPETAAISGVRQAAIRFQNGGRAQHHVLEAALAHRLDVGAGGEDLVGAGDHDAADLLVGVEALDRRGELLHQLGREGVARLGAVQPAEGDVPVDRGLDHVAHVQASGSATIGVIAFSPVASRPMISFWICEVPS